MMKIPTKLMVTVAASLLGVAVAASGAYAASGSLTTSDAPGQVLHVSGVGPAADHASATAAAHANVKARGLVGSASSHVRAPAGAAASHVRVPSSATTMHANASAGATARPMTAAHSAVGQVARPAPQALPAYHAVMPHVTAPVAPHVVPPMMGTGTTPPSPPMMH